MTDVFDIREARRRLIEYAKHLGDDVGSQHESDTLFNLARDYVDAERRLLEDALREKVDEVKERG